MKYIEAFRNGDAGKFLSERIKIAAKPLEESGQELRVMEVCGSHTMSIARYGIKDILPNNVKLISGPGCPVCVTDTGYIDAAIELANRGITIATFGDMVRVPGSDSTLAEARSKGGRVEICYSPMDALKLAQKEPEQEVVFLAIGFETTIAPLISLIKQAAKLELKNISILTAFKLVPPALSALTEDPEVKVNAFLCPAHVSAIIGVEAYRPYVEKYHIPCVIAGFEPLDILYALENLAQQLAEGKAELVNQYSRVVKAEGNLIAQALISEYLEEVDAPWRGLGTIPKSGLGLKEEFSFYDAQKRYGISCEGGKTHPGCRCGEVLKGKISPNECPLFDKACTPMRPFGPCMVSSEGSCAAYYKYVR